MNKLLNNDSAGVISTAVLDALDEVGFGASEGIPGLILAIYRLADQTGDPEQALDEAANLLADGVDVEENT